MAAAFSWIAHLIFDSLHLLDHHGTTRKDIKLYYKIYQVIPKKDIKLIRSTTKDIKLYYKRYYQHHLVPARGTKSD